MEFMKVMEAITVVVTLMMFSTGIIPCRQMVSTKSTKNVPYHMFLLGGLGCLGMFHYGLLVGNVVLIFLNGVGAILNTVYTFLYLSVVKSKETPLAMLLGAILYEITLYTYIFKFQEHTAERADTLGMCSSLLTLFLMILPAFEVINNIRNKNADGMPAVMLIGGILCSTCWLTYGIMLHDPNIYTPNIPGIFISSVKLYLIFLYSEGTDDKED